jgi:hypothetical protein
MSQQELLKRVIKLLDKVGIQYMVTGSIISSLQGEPRLTHDVDIVISIKKPDVKHFTNEFHSPDFYLNEDSIIDAIKYNSSFNLLEVNSGDKVDFWLLTNESFDKMRFSRRITDNFLDFYIQVSSPEDTILEKLKWCKLSNGSEKHFIDALKVYELQLGKLDINYIEHWVKELNIESLWLRIINEAEIT